MKNTGDGVEVVVSDKEKFLKILTEIPPLARLDSYELKEIEIIGQAQDADQAITSIKKLNPDVVILDIALPKGSGIDVLQKIKKDKPGPTVIIFTLYTSLQYREKCMAAEADFFFNKSTEFEKIPDVLKKLIQDSST